MSEYTDQQYLDAIDDLYDDGEADIRSYERKIVKVRKEQTCMAADLVDEKKGHSIPIGSKAVRESAIVDNEWGSSYSCLPCIGKFLESFKEPTQ